MELAADQEYRLNLGSRNFTKPKRVHASKSVQLPLEGILLSNGAPLPLYRREIAKSESGLLLKTFADSTTSTDFSYTKAIVRHLLNKLSRLGFVENVYAYVEDNTCQVNVVANRPSRTERNKLWQAYMLFIKQYPDIDMDFRLHQRRGRSEEQFLPNRDHTLLIPTIV